MTVTFDLLTAAKSAMGVLCVLSVLVLVLGDLPDHQGHSWANGLRVIVWPLTLIGLLGFLARGCLL